MAALLRTLALSPISTFFRLMTVPIAAASAKNAIRQDLCIAGNGAVLDIYGHLALRSVVKDIGQNVRDPF